MITESTFNRFSPEQKATLVDSCGTYLATRYTQLYKVELYILDGIYVEVWRSFALFGKFRSKIKPVAASMKLLEKYVKSIELDI